MDYGHSELVMSECAPSGGGEAVERGAAAAADPVIRQQIDYYRKRATEYDDWFFQRGRYDAGNQRRQEWQTEIARTRAMLGSLGPVEEALELACGTGIWTERLREQARRVTAVDASPEVVELARQRVNHDPRVTFQVADLFAYEPLRRYDLVLFTFWLSHVPPARLSRFFALLRRSLRPGGVLFALDQRATAAKQTSDDTLQPRSLADGRTFQVVKVYYRPPDLQALFAEHGFSVQVTTTPSLWVAVAR